MICEISSGVLYWNGVIYPCVAWFFIADKFYHVRLPCNRDSHLLYAKTARITFALAIFATGLIYSPLRIRIDSMAGKDNCYENQEMSAEAYVSLLSMIGHFDPLIATKPYGPNPPEVDCGYLPSILMCRGKLVILERSNVS